MTEKENKAYLAKNEGKEHLYTVAYTYHGTGNGYPAGDGVFVCPLATEESHTSAATKNKRVSSMAANGIDYAGISEQRSINGGAYKTISKTDFKYDSHGNEIQGKVYPSYGTARKKKSFRTTTPTTASDSRQKRPSPSPQQNGRRTTAPTPKKK